MLSTLHSIFLNGSPTIIGISSFVILMAKTIMDRLKVLKASWFMAVALGKQPSRRVIQEITKATAGTAFRTQEVHAFLKAWQFIGQDGRPHLRTELSPVGNHCESKLSPVVSPVAVLKKLDLSPVDRVTRVHSESNTRADLESNVEENIKVVVSQQHELKLEHEAPKASKPKRGPSEDDFRAFAIRDLLAKHIEPMLNGMTIVAWKKANVRACSDLAKAGKTPEQVLAYWQSHTASDGRPFVVVSYLQQHMARNGMPQAATPKPAARGAPAERYVPKNLRVDNDIFAQLDRIGRQNALPTRQ